MVKSAPIQSNFTGGEFSPLLDGRVDSDRYKSGLKTCVNYVPTLQGPLTRRPGTKFGGEVKTSSKLTRVLPFEFSTTQAYTIEMGEYYFRFWKNNGIVTNTPVAITAATAANPVVITAASHGLSDGNRVVVSGVSGMSEINNREFTVANKTTNTFELSGVNGLAYTPYTSGGTVARVYEIVHPYAEADLAIVKYTQSADILYLTHPNYAPRKLSRTAHNAWTLTVLPFLDGPYLSSNSTTTTLTPSGTTGSITLTASAVTGINGGAGFALTDVGRLIRFQDSASNWTWLEITAWTSTTVVTVTVVGDDLPNTNARKTWRLGLYSETTGYPTAVTFHEDRLVFVGSRSAQQRADGSNSGDYENFAPSDRDGTITADKAYAFSVNSSTVNVIRWVQSTDRGLILGTVGGNWLLGASDSSQALSATNVSARPITPFGCADVRPIQAGAATLYVQKAGRKIREMQYSFYTDGYQAEDLTVLAEHIATSGIVDATYVNEPQPIAWYVRADGALAGVTYDRNAETLRAGWHRQILGGFSDAGRTTQAVVESVASIPSADGSRDEMAMVVKRYIDGGTKRYIEYLQDFFPTDGLLEDAYFVDCGLTYDGAEVTTIAGLWHLNGETVSILADGAVRPDQVVTNGKITLTSSASKVHIGYGYTSDFQLLRLESGSTNGTSIGKTRRTHRIGFMLLNTLGGKFGFSFDALDDMIFRTTSDPLGNPPEMFSGIKSKEGPADYDYDNNICWRQDQPLPSTILAVMPQMETEDRL